MNCFVRIITFMAGYFSLAAYCQPAIEWQKHLGGSSQDAASAVCQTTDGGYIVTGTTSSYDEDVTGNYGQGDVWVVKLSANGNLQWHRCLGGSGPDGGSCVQQTVDGGYLIAGSTASNDGDVSGLHGGGEFIYDFWVVKLDGNGIIQWQKCLGGSGSDEVRAVQQ